MKVNLYINLFTDFGFKKIFGEEPNKDLLIAFLNSLLHEEETVVDVQYQNVEKSGVEARQRRAIYDLYCTNEQGDRFIVEIQRAKQRFFKDRSLYYATHAIADQAVKGRDWDFQLTKVYLIAIMDFAFDDSDADKLLHRVQLHDSVTKALFYDKLTFIYLEVPKFKKRLDELTTDFERWIFAFRNLHRLKNYPASLTEGIFQKLLTMAEIAKLDPQQRHAYEDSLKVYRDLKNIKDTAFEEGREAGREEGREEGFQLAKTLLARRLLLAGILDVEAIAAIAEMSVAAVEALREEGA